MPRYHVRYEYTTWSGLFVEAEDEDLAERIADESQTPEGEKDFAVQRAENMEYVETFVELVPA